MRHDRVYVPLPWIEQDWPGGLCLSPSAAQNASGVSVWASSFSTWKISR